MEIGNLSQIDIAVIKIRDIGWYLHRNSRGGIRFLTVTVQWYTELLMEDYMPFWEV